MPRPNSLPERLTVFEPITGWKSLCIMHLVPYRSQSSPTDFPEELKIQGLDHGTHEGEGYQFSRENAGTGA